jgi:hypothetical protein
MTQLENNNIVCSISSEFVFTKRVERFNTAIRFNTSRHDNGAARVLNSGQWVTRPRRRRTNGRDHIVCMWCPVQLVREKTSCDNEIPAKWCPVCPAACFSLLMYPTTLTVTQRTTLWRFQTKDTWNFSVSNGVEFACENDDDGTLVD